LAIYLLITVDALIFDQSYHNFYCFIFKDVDIYNFYTQHDQFQILVSL